MPWKMCDQIFMIVGPDIDDVTNVYQHTSGLVG